MKRTPNRTLIIRLSSIGDIVLASPLIRLLQKKNPQAEIDFVVKSEYQELVQHNPHLRYVIGFHTRGGFGELKALRRKIRQERYDLIIDIHGNFRSTFLRSGASSTVLKINKRRLARFFLINFKWNTYRSVTAVPLRYLEAVHSLGIEDDGEGLEIFVPEDMRLRVRGQLSRAGIDGQGYVIGICPGANHATKRWLQEYFGRLGVTLVKEDNAKLILFGGKDDQAICNGIERRVVQETGRESDILNCAGTQSLLETASAMDACETIVTNDSGLLHLAAARKRKVVAIFGPTVREFGFYPYGTQSRVIERQGLYCRPCTHIGGQTCPEGHFRCMKEITVEEALSAVRSFSQVGALDKTKNPSLEPATRIPAT
jgi:lipopolysaccharide heptosyltransferase II